MPSCVASERTMTSRARPGSATRVSIQRSNDPAQAKIAPTHEKESANDAVATLAGRKQTTISAAAARAFHDSVARPQARPTSAAVAMLAALTAGSWPPLHHTNVHDSAIAKPHVTARG